MVVGLPLSLGQRLRVVPVCQEDGLTQVGGAVLQRADPAAERHQALPERRAAHEGRVAETVDQPAGAVVRVQHPAMGVEHYDSFAERLHHGLADGGEGGR